MIKASGGDVAAELLTPRFLGAEATGISLNKIRLNHCLRFAPSSQFAVCGSFLTNKNPFQLPQNSFSSPGSMLIVLSSSSPIFL